MAWPHWTRRTAPPSNNRHARSDHLRLCPEVTAGGRVLCGPTHRRFLLFEIVIREQRVQPATGLAEHLPRLLALRLAARVRDLRRGSRQLADLLIQRREPVRPRLLVASRRLPERGELLLAPRDVLPPRLGEMRDPTTALLRRADQAFVLELLQNRVNGPRAGPPLVIRATADLLHQLVTMARFLRQQGEDRRTHRTGRTSTAAGRAAEKPSWTARAAGKPGEAREPGKPRPMRRSRRTGRPRREAATGFEDGVVPGSLVSRVTGMAGMAEVLAVAEVRVILP